MYKLFKSKNTMHSIIAILSIFVSINCGLFSGTSDQASNNPMPYINEVSANSVSESFVEEQTQTKPRRNLLLFAEGTIMPIPSEQLLVTAPILLIDGSPIHNWVGAAGAKPESFIFEMPDKATIQTLVFDDDTSGMGGTNAGIKDLTVEVSDVSLTAGFQEIFSGHLEIGKNDQTFAVTKPVAGRWVRVNFKTNFGGESFSLSEIRAYGDVANSALSTNLSGSYEVLSGIYNITQEGTLITGCYEPNSIYTNPGTFSGGVEGNIGKVIYTDIHEDENPEDTPMFFVFSRNGKHFFKAIITSGGGLSDYEEVKRISNTPGICKNRNKTIAPKSPILDTLEKKGHVKLYGVNFDFNSDVLRPESKTLLDKVATMLKDNPSLKIVIEGHTDDIGSDKYNMVLSEKRAVAVKNFLVTAGIAEIRLKAVGKGMTEPAASNESGIGQAQNRRVVLVKQ